MSNPLSISAKSLYASTALVLSLSAGIPFAASAQTAAPAASEPTTEVVVTGQRASHRSRLNTLAPVDVVTKDSLTSQGSDELAQGLSRVVPSLNFPRPAATDGPTIFARHPCVVCRLIRPWFWSTASVITPLHWST